MANIKSKGKTKRLSKGQRTHYRRLKQEARKEITPTSPQSGAAQPARPPKKQE